MEAPILDLSGCSFPDADLLPLDDAINDVDDLDGMLGASNATDAVNTPFARQAGDPWSLNGSCLSATTPKYLGSQSPGTDGEGWHPWSQRVVDQDLLVCPLNRASTPDGSSLAEDGCHKTGAGPTLLPAASYPLVPACLEAGDTYLSRSPLSLPHHLTAAAGMSSHLGRRPDCRLHLFGSVDFTVHVWCLRVLLT